LAPSPFLELMKSFSERVTNKFFGKDGLRNKKAPGFPRAFLFVIYLCNPHVYR